MGVVTETNSSQGNGIADTSSNQRDGIADLSREGLMSSSVEPLVVANVEFWSELVNPNKWALCTNQELESQIPSGTVWKLKLTPSALDWEAN